MRKKRPTYLSFINFLVFCLFFVALWFYAFDLDRAATMGISRVHLEMALLQSVSFLMVMTAVQMPKNRAGAWRPLLLGLSFVALSEASLVALLTPIV